MDTLELRRHSSRDSDGHTHINSDRTILGYDLPGVPENDSFRPRSGAHENARANGPSRTLFRTGFWPHLCVPDESRPGRPLRPCVDPRSAKLPLQRRAIRNYAARHGWRGKPLEAKKRRAPHKLSDAYRAARLSFHMCLSGPRAMFASRFSQLCSFFLLRRCSKINPELGRQWR